MNVLNLLIHVVRLVAGMLFVALAGALTLLATGIGRVGWSLAGDRPAEPFVADSEAGRGWAASAV